MRLELPSDSSNAGGVIKGFGQTVWQLLHSSDLHLGRRFHQFPGEIASPLEEARFEVISSLARQARGAGASTILLAGDTWDSEVPSERVLRQSLDRFAAQDDMRWLIMPGNHDPVGAGDLWGRVAAAGLANVELLTERGSHEVAPDVWLLAAPCAAGAAAVDPTVWMNAEATPEGALRIGAAHGPALGFGDAGDQAVISPTRATEAGLDYLALGDWHGWTLFGDRTLYPGTPEPDRFRDGSGLAASVRLAGGGAAPEIGQCLTARFHWLKRDFDLSLAEDPAAALSGALPPGAPRSDILMSLAFSGSVGPEAQVRWTGAADDLGLSLRHLDIDASAVVSLVAADDLDLIDQQGALRTAADSLLAASVDPDAAAEERDAAKLALDLLFTWSTQEEAAS